MKLNSFESVKQLTENMVAIPSINKEPGGESAVARYMQDFYMSLPYFQAHPEQVKCFQTKNDFVVRHSTLAYVKGTKGNSNRTVILIGHIDTVGVDDFGTIREYAFRCEELPAKLRETFVLPQEVINDIESGEYLFGRGALDMKSGVAGHMYLIQYFSEHPEELDGNLLAIGECDEEDNSKGIITALDLLEELADTISKTALCGLGQSACKPVQSTLKYFRDEYLAHVVDHHCPICNKEKPHPTIDPEKCKGCGKCRKNCPMEAITGAAKQVHVIDPEKCINCGACVTSCPFGAIAASK